MRRFSVYLVAMLLTISAGTQRTGCEQSADENLLSVCYLPVADKFLAFRQDCRNAHCHAGRVIRDTLNSCNYASDSGRRSGLSATPLFLFRQSCVKATRASIPMEKTATTCNAGKRFEVT